MTDSDDEALFTDSDGIPTLFDVVATGDRAGGWSDPGAVAEDQTPGEGEAALAASIERALQRTLPEVITEATSRALEKPATNWAH